MVALFAADYGLGSIADHDVTKEELLDKMKEKYTSIIQSKPVAEQNTPQWKEERLERLTSSNFGKVCRLRDTTNRYNTVKSILYTAWSGNAATMYGHDQESVSEDMYKDFISKNYVGASIKEINHPGLLAIDESPELAASPDGIATVDCPTLPPKILLEYKNPKSLVDKRLSVNDAIDTIPNFPLQMAGNKYTLKKSHPFYYQIQGALKATKLSLCHLVLRGYNSIAVVDVPFDHIFYEAQAAKLRVFYFNYILPELAHPLFQYGGIRDCLGVDPDEFVSSCGAL